MNEPPRGFAKGLAPFEWFWLAVAVVAGAALRIWQYAANPSIWVDEAALARLILERAPLELFGRLVEGQSAPLGFLLAVKASVTLLGSSEYALRLVPLVAGILSPALFFVVARSLLRPVGALVGTFLVSFAVPLVFFSANLKQYSSDVTVTLLVLCVALFLLRSSAEGRRAYGFAAVSLPLLFFSHGAAFPVAAAGAVIVAEAFLTRRTDRWRRAGIVTVWAAAVLATLAYGALLLTAPDVAYMKRFWNYAFMPRQGTLGWLWAIGVQLFDGPRLWTFSAGLHYPWPGAFAVLAVVGCVVLCVRVPSRGLIVAGAIGLTLAASFARAYPFGGRTTLFLLPLFLLAVVAAFEWIGDLLVHRHAREYAPLFLLPLAVFALVQHRPPRKPEHVRPVMQYLADHWRAGDALWVYYGAGQAFAYYSKRIPIPVDVRIGECDRGDPRAYLRQLDAERGRRRVWVLMAHGPGPFRFNERLLILDYLASIGRPLDACHAPEGDSSSIRAALYLFDLSDPVRLASTSAERFPIHGSPPSQRWSCYATMSPFGSNDRIIQAVLDPNLR